MTDFHDKNFTGAQLIGLDSTSTVEAYVDELEDKVSFLEELNRNKEIEIEKLEEKIAYYQAKIESL